MATEIENTEVETELEDIEYDTKNVTDGHEALFRELTGGTAESLEDPEEEAPDEEVDDESDQSDPDTDTDVEDQAATEGDQKDQPTESDQLKADRAVESIGKKSYIDMDLINSIDDKELRQKVWNLANTAQSHYNRVYAREQEVNKLRNQITQFEAEREVAKQDAGSKSEAKRIDEMTDAKIKRLKEDYPDLADSIESMLGLELEKRTKDIRETFEREYSPIKQQFEEQSRAKELSILQDAANEIFQTDQTGISYKEVVASPDFQTWLSEQDAQIKSLVNSNSAAEVVTALKVFEADYSRNYRKTYGQSWVDAVLASKEGGEETKTSAPVTDSEETKRADQIRQQRDQKKKKAVTGIAPGRHQTNSTANVDSDSLFNHFAKQSRYAR